MRRVALIGCGAIAEIAHAPALERIRDVVETRALAEPRAARRAVLGERLGVPEQRRYRDAHEMLRRERVDVAIVATPPDTHEALAAAALRACPHVIAEKPIGRTVAEIDRLIESAEAAGSRLSVLHNHLYDSRFDALYRLIGKGRLGAVRGVRFRHFMPGPFAGPGSSSASWRLSGATSGGGCLIDLGYHAVYLAEHLAGAAIETIAARLGNDGGQGDVEDLAFVLARHAGGGLSSLQLGWCAAYHEAEVEVLGRKATARATSPGALAVRDRDDGDWSEVPVEDATLVGSYERMLRDLLGPPGGPACGRLGAPCGRRVLALIEAAYASARTGDAVGV